jgi:hypothetical protein
MRGATSTSGAASARTSGHRRRPLSRQWRRAVLAVHIIAGGTWIGIDVIVAVLVLTGRFSGDVAVRSLAFRSLAAFAVWPMLTAGLVSLASGVALGRGTRWGLVRYWWVAVKLALNVVLCALILLVLQPGMSEVGQYGQDLLAGHPDPGRVSTLFFPPAVSLTALALATVLAVFKPWGRTRAGGGREPEELRSQL